MTILSDKLVKTRKSHHCFACDRVFQAGTQMHRQVNTLDGIVTVYTCAACIEILPYIELNGWDDYYEPGCTGELIADYKFTGTVEEFAAWAKENLKKESPGL